MLVYIVAAANDSANDTALLSAHTSHWSCLLSRMRARSGTHTRGRTQIAVLSWIDGSVWC